MVYKTTEQAAEYFENRAEVEIDNLGMTEMRSN